MTYIMWVLFVIQNLFVMGISVYLYTYSDSLWAFLLLIFWLQPEGKTDEKL